MPAFLVPTSLHNFNVAPPPLEVNIVRLQRAILFQLATLSANQLSSRPFTL